MKGTGRPDLGRGGLLEQVDRFPFTFGVLGAIVVLYVFAAVQQGQPAPSGELLFRLGANNPAVVLVQPWRLVTSAFLHADLIHLAFNGLALFLIGRTLEVHYGSARLWVLFFAFALVSSAGSAAWNVAALRGLVPAQPAQSVGASGGVYGLILLGYVYGRAHPQRLGSLAANLQNWIVIGVVFTFFAPRIDIAGHLAGAAAGAAAGALVQPKPGADPHPAWKPAAITLALLCLGCFALAVLGLRGAGSP